MGYPNPHESAYDLFMTGHAGCSVSCALGLKAGDDLRGENRAAQRRGRRRRRPAVGDRLRGAQQRRRPAQGPAGHSQRQRDVDLPARRRPGPLPRPGADDQLLPGVQDGTSAICWRAFRCIGGLATHACEQIKDGLKAFLTGGMLFEEMGFRYFGPIDGHDLPNLRRWLRDVKDAERPDPAARPDAEGPRRTAGQRRPGDVPHAAGDREGRPRPHHPVAEARRLARLHRRGERRHPPGDDRRPARHGADGGDVPGQQAGEGAGGVPRPLLRRGHLRVARRRLRRRHGQGRNAAHRGHLFDVFAARRSTRSSRKWRCRTCR